MRDREREAETRQSEKQAPCREPDVGLDPRSPGSRRGKKAGAKPLGHPGGSVVEHLPLAQDVILDSWDRVPHRAPCMEPAFPSAYVSSSLSVSLVNKLIN